MTSPPPVTLTNGLQLVARPAGPTTAEVVVREPAPEGQIPKVITADTGNLSTASRRERMAARFVAGMVANELIGDLPPEPTPWRLRKGIPEAEATAKANLAEVAQAAQAARATKDLNQTKALRQQHDELNSEWKRLMEAAKNAEGDEREARERVLGSLRSEVERGLLELGLAVEELRSTSKEGEKPAQGRALQFDDVEPWSEAVDGAQLLDGIAGELKRFIVMTKEAADTVALWIEYSHAFDSFDTSPILAIQSATLGCGKTTLLRIIEGMVPRSYRAVGFSEATVFRLIERWRPTLLIDEADRAKDREGLIQVINAGLERGGSVPRCVGDDNEVHAFSVWAPKVLAGIGKLNRTLQDRGVVILLKRATKKERGSVVRYRDRSARATLAEHCRRAARWAADNADKLAALGQREDAPLGDELDDRASEQLWLPLISVADAAGGEWPTRARRAALALSGGRDRDEEDLGVVLIRDLAAVFEEDGSDFIPTDDLVGALNKLDERPWRAFGRTKDGLDANGLARMLRGFRVRSRQRRVGAPNATRGYDKADLADLFARYREVPPVTPVTGDATDSAVTGSTVTGGGREPVTPAVTAQAPARDELGSGVTGVTARKPGNGKGHADISDCPLCGRDACAGDCFTVGVHEAGSDGWEAV